MDCRVLKLYVRMLYVCMYVHTYIHTCVQVPCFVPGGRGSNAICLGLWRVGVRSCRALFIQPAMVVCLFVCLFV